LIQRLQKNKGVERELNNFCGTGRDYIYLGILLYLFLSFIFVIFMLSPASNLYWEFVGITDCTNSLICSPSMFEYFPLANFIVSFICFMVIIENTKENDKGECVE